MLKWPDNFHLWFRGTSNINTSPQPEVIDSDVLCRLGKDKVWQKNYSIEIFYYTILQYNHFIELYLYVQITFMA